jgi:hypothetical protein
MVLETTRAATPQRYRFVDSVAFVEHKCLRICELPAFPYSAVSYVWRGNPADPAVLADGTFHVKGAEDGDPISIDVL